MPALNANPAPRVHRISPRFGTLQRGITNRGKEGTGFALSSRVRVRNAGSTGSQGVGSMYDRCQINDASVRSAFRELMLRRAKVEACEARLLSAAREQREGLVQEQMNLEQEW